MQGKSYSGPAAVSGSNTYGGAANAAALLLRLVTLHLCHSSYVLRYTVFSKNCAFFNPLQPIPRLHIAARDFRPYFIQPITVQCWRGRSLKILKISWKHQVPDGHSEIECYHRKCNHDPVCWVVSRSVG